MSLKPTRRYDDIIDLPHHRSDKHPHMSRHNRAAQFMPFAALSGYDAVIAEQARLTRRRIVLDADAQAEVDAQLRTVCARASASIRSGAPLAVSVTYFRLDERKSGGEYVTVADGLRLKDDETGELVFASGLRVPVGDVIAIDEVE